MEKELEEKKELASQKALLNKQYKTRKKAEETKRLADLEERQRREERRLKNNQVVVKNMSKAQLEGRESAADLDRMMQIMDQLWQETQQIEDVLNLQEDDNDPCRSERTHLPTSPQRRSHQRRSIPTYSSTHAPNPQ